MSFITILKHFILKNIVNTIGPKIVYYMALTGNKTDECMDKGCLPVLTDYYQPIPNLKDLEQKKVWDKVSELKGITWEPQKFLQRLHELSYYADECDWPNEPTIRVCGGIIDPMEFYLNNRCFSYGCAAMLHCIIRKNKPARIIEVGSGNSSRVIAAALSANILDDNFYNCEYTIIDPYSQIDVSLYPKGTKLLKQQVENVDISVFKELSENDILFIDSSHVCKIGSDVNFEILEVLPVLNSGVYVHFHDIALPYEYPKVLAVNPKTGTSPKYSIITFNKKFPEFFFKDSLYVTHRENNLVIIIK